MGIPLLNQIKGIGKMVLFHGLEWKILEKNGRVLNKSIQYVNSCAVKGGKLFSANSIIVSTTATIGEHALITVPFLSNDQFTNLSLKSEYTNKFLIKFLFYYGFVLDEWCKNNTTVGSFASVNMNGFKKFLIPIPPLEIQQEIVRILDTFTRLIAELTAELTARKKQYAYYREQLLTFKEGEVEWKSLGEVTNYKQPNKYLVKSTNYKDYFPIPVLTAGKTFILGYTNETTGVYKASENPIIIFDDFTTDNKWVDFDFKAKSGAMKMIISKDETKVILKYIYYWLNTLPKITDGDHKRRWIGNYFNKLIPVPPLRVQQEIVRILDKFDTLTTSISEGLPREIELRKKQYAYYREQLLDFPGGKRK